MRRQHLRAAATVAAIAGGALGAAALAAPSRPAPPPAHVQVDYAGAVEPGSSVSATWRVGQATWPARWIGIEPGSRNPQGYHSGVVQIATLGDKAAWDNWPAPAIDLVRLPVGSLVAGSVSPTGPSSWKLAMTDPAAHWSWHKTVSASRPWRHPIAVITVEGKHGPCRASDLACAAPPQPWPQSITFSDVRVDGRLLARPPGRWLVLRRPGLSATPRLVAPGRLVIPPSKS